MQTATNPETGERFVLVNGEWQPMQTATNPETGQQFALVDNEWQEMPSSAPPEPYQGTYGPLMDGLIEGVATVGSSVAGGIAGTLGGLWDAVTGEDYETARETQDRISSNLTYSPVSDGGCRAAEIISDAVDNPCSITWVRRVKRGGKTPMITSRKRPLLLRRLLQAF